MTPTHTRRRTPRVLLALALTLAPAAACRSRESSSPAQQSSLLPASTRANAVQTAAVGGGERSGAEHVTVGAFCDRLGAVFCQHCAPGTADCLQSFMNGCLEGHDRSTPTAHTEADLQACAREMTNGDCARMMAAGELPQACQ